MEILTADQMRAADRETYERLSLSETELMENAGFAAACQIARRYGKRPVTVLCGAGNNGGDGFVVARLLRQRGWFVDVAFVGDERKMSPAARFHAGLFKGTVRPPSFKRLKQTAKLNGLFVDAVFGTGLSRPVGGDLADFFNALNETEVPCCALDIPSGVVADTGEIAGAAPFCDMTVTFCRPKIGHFLYPARERAGDLVVCPIGIPDEIVARQKPSVFENTPDLFSVPDAVPADNKYSRGAVLVRAGEMTGAARLAAAAARRSGAGWVGVSCDSDRRNFFALDAETVVLPADTPEELKALLDSRKISAAVIGMGLPETPRAKEMLNAVAASKKPFVADAGVLPFVKNVKDPSRAVVTPHAGEFRRMFPDMAEKSKLDQALTAAKSLNCVVVLKGADTVIAAPDGRAAINATTAFNLATAGSGDVLSGVIGAMLAKSLPPFEAACAGVRLHSRAAESVPRRDLTASDIIDALGEIR